MGISHIYLKILESSFWGPCLLQMLILEFRSLAAQLGSVWPLCGHDAEKACEFLRMIPTLSYSYHLGSRVQGTQFLELPHMPTECEELASLASDLRKVSRMWWLPPVLSREVFRSCPCSSRQPKPFLLFHLYSVDCDLNGQYSHYTTGFAYGIPKYFHWLHRDTTYCHFSKGSKDQPRLTLPANPMEMVYPSGLRDAPGFSRGPRMRVTRCLLAVKRAWRNGPP